MAGSPRCQIASRCHESAMQSHSKHHPTRSSARLAQIACKVSVWRGPVLSDSRGTLAARSAARHGPLRTNPPHRVQHPIRRIHPVQILRHLRAQKPARHRMLRITLNLCRTPVLHGDQDPASVGTIVRTRGMHDLLHGNDSFDYTWLLAIRWTTKSRCYSWQKKTGRLSPSACKTSVE